MKAIRRPAAILLALVLFVGLLAPTVPKVNAAISTSTFNTRVQEFISDSRWKNGTAWTSSQTPKLSTWSSTGCCAYAADFAAYVYGSTSAAWTTSDFTKFTDLNEIRAGDIIHITGHWFVVLERSGNSFRTAEGSFDSKARVCSDGWAIKNGKIHNLKATDSERTFEYGYHYKFSDSTTTTTYSSSQIYYNIDMSSAVLASRIGQQVTNDCGVVSMATVEAYLYGATSSGEKDTVYNALVSANGDNDYANWSSCGYVSHSSIDWGTVYDRLCTGFPVIVHRPATSSKSQHWAVVAGYKGSTTTLEADKFIIVDVYHGTGGTDIYTSGAWRGSATIDRMVTRKNGIAITSLSGIRMAINHPSVVHQYGNGHGVYGYVASNAALTSVQVAVTNTATGTAVYNKTITPNAKSYSIYALDSEMTFAKWAKGKYSYTVTAKTASSSRTYQYTFEIASGWPVDQSVQSYAFSYNANGGTGAPGNQTVVFGGTLHISPVIPTRSGYTFLGWHCMRNADQTWYSAGNGWNTEEQLKANGYQKRVYPVDTDFIINNSWVSGCTETTGFTFYAVWEAEPVVTYTISYDANGGTGAPASQTKTHDVDLTLSSTIPTRSGYTFLGWATSSSATSASYQPGGSFTTNANTTLYAVWKQDEQATGAQIVVGTAKASPGSEVRVTVSLVDNPGVWGMDLVVVYDKTKMTLTDVENGTVFSSSEWTEGNYSGEKYVLSYEAGGFENITADGVLATLVFTVNEATTADQFVDVSVSYSAGDIINVEFEDIDMKVVSGGVEVEDFVYGDLNGDGLVNKKDSLLMKMYLADDSTVIDERAADVYADGAINKKDSLYLKQYLAGLDVELGTK